jgi:uncharacterized protein
MKLSRRKFISTTLGALTLTPIVANAYLFDTETIYTSIISLSIKDLPTSFNGYKIAFLTDIHYGISQSPEFLQDVVNTTISHSPDLVLLGGDYIWIPHSFSARNANITRNSKLKNIKYHKLVTEIFNTVAEKLATINPPDGIFGVLGNHDRHHNGDFCKSIFKKNNIEILVNQTANITRGNESISILGVDDYLTGSPTLIDKPHIIISHNPDFISDVLNYSEISIPLGLCGHTHGGQIRVPGINFAPVTNVNDKRLAFGLFKNHQAQVYTSCGIGTVEFPIRIACPPEITILNLN